MARFSSTLSSLGKMEQKLVLGKLRTFAKYSAINGQFLKNLNEETLVSGAAWSELVQAILTSPSDPSKLRSSMRSALRKHLFSGPPAKCSSHTLFGRATTGEDLARTFLSHHYFGSLSGALSHIRTMKGRDVATLRDKWRGYHLASFVMWSTFDPSGARPFQGLRRSARFLRALFGLPILDVDSPLILLEYILPEDVVARMPTLVEAYAGDDWLYYFRPAGDFEIEDGYGRTYVWDDLARSGETGRPEVVHKPITGNSLANELEEVP